jgi:hypothetical protein
MLDAIMQASSEIRTTIAHLTSARDRTKGMVLWRELSKALRALEAAEMRVDAVLVELSVDACRLCGELPNANRPVGTEPACPDCGVAYYVETYA